MRANTRRTNRLNEPNTATTIRDAHRPPDQQR
jgi:hypothetical protein